MIPGFKLYNYILYRYNKKRIGKSVFNFKKGQKLQPLDIEMNLQEHVFWAVAP